MVLLYAPTTTPPDAGPRIKKWTSCQHVWTGWDGTEFDLTTGISGARLLAGVRGMRPAPFQTYWTEPAAVAGSFYRGSSTGKRDAFWPLRLFADSGTEAWIEHNRRFWATMDEDKPGVWTVIQPSGERRSLHMRFAGLADESDDTDPGLRGWAHYGINFIADLPYWRGEPVRRVFRAAGGGGNYYGGGGPGGSGPPYVTLPGSTTENARISNAGQVPAAPVWRIDGPTTSVSVGIDGHPVTVPFAVAEGDSVTIDAHPTRQDAIDQDGVDRTPDLGAVDFADIPPGANVPLEVAIAGAGTVTLDLVPLFKRATG